ncbi:zinc finger protein 236-like isoform X1 [Salarias fasciatus]|uniref:Serendipity locus protein delta-like n=1 Tax=Salarias fasciatus TaxID=181472 RepID=A0A672G9Z9_SALFA|nr:zinc finger protein 236-like isoform X1 [Salarias fasciatus]XP_029956567.1 zinc finger protein 236-like isoform X1 [Salarias fasciatus]
MAKRRHANCGVLDCTHRGESLFLLPTSEPVRKKWLDYIFGGHVPNRIPKRFYVCARHFTHECFSNIGQYSSGSAQRLRIKKDAVPTLRDPKTSVGDIETADQLKHINPIVDRGKEESEPEEALSAQEGCSVIGCDSYRRSAQRLKLPEDSERRKEWIQFVLKVNRQQLKDSWTDITICSEHFTNDCFVKTNPESGAVQLSTDAVPSLYIKSEEQEPANSRGHVLSPGVILPQNIKSEEEEPWSPEHLSPGAILSLNIKSEEEEPWSPEHVFSPGAIISLKIKSEEEEPTEEPTRSPKHELSETSDVDETLFNGSELHENSIPCSGASEDLSPDASSSALVQTQQKELTTDVNQKIAVFLQTKGKFVVNEKCLFQLLGRNCPSCQSKLQMEKVTYEAFLILNQRCLKCDYTNQWKNMAGAHIPAAEDGDAVEETSESPQAAAPSFNSAVVSEIVVFSDEESDASENVEEAEEEDGSSIDEEWNLTGEVLLAEELELESENEEAEEESTDENKLGGGVVRELCAECGKFFDKRKHHVCAHKGRPFACNVCGKRCVSELSLKIHSRIHQENYEHLCKYCYLPFKTRVDKQKHEDAHKMKNDPYSCSDCPQTFTSYKQRRSHLLTHRGLRERKCGVCGMVFTSWEHLGRHSFVHTGLKPHKCSVCDRSFKQSSHLKSHMRLHTGERPYACSHCDRAFNHNVSLKSHVQQCHASNGGAQDETGPDVEFDGVEEEPKKKAKMT